MLKLSFHGIEQLTTICNALSTPLRVQILQQISDKNLSIIQLAEALDTSVSTIAANVKILEAAELLITQLHPATRGTKRVCSKNYADIFINLDMRYPLFSEDKVYEINMPIGHYADCTVSPTCGLIGDNGTIGSEDFQSSFFNPGRINAKHLWFRTGHIIYRFPNEISNFQNMRIKSIDFSLELCSEAPNFEMDWPSDITFWINDVEITTWTSPSDFGDRQGKLKSCLWERKFFSQYGLLQNIHINTKGTFLNDKKVASTTISDLNLSSQVIDFKIGVKSDAQNKGGVNIFGRGFGDYDQDIRMEINYKI